MVLIQRVFVVCGRVARAVADSYRRVAHRPASTDDLTVESRGDVDRRRRPRSRGSFGALTLILQQVKRQVQKSIQECDSRMHSPSGGKSSLVPLVVKTLKESVFCVVILVARRRDLRGLVSGVDVCVCVCYNGGGARLSTLSRRIHRTSSRASGSRAAAVPRLGLNRRSVTSREDIFAHESSNRKEKTFERVQLCAPWRVRGESGVRSRLVSPP